MNRIKSIAILFFVISLSVGISYAGETNLAQGRLVRVNAYRGSYFPEYVVDGNRGRGYWETGWPCWIEIDLEEPKEINKIHLYMWHGDKRYYQYYIEVSSDRKKWKEVVDERKNTKSSSSEGRVYTFTPTKATFVRLTVTYNSVKQSAHVKEIEVYGK